MEIQNQPINNSYQNQDKNVEEFKIINLKNRYKLYLLTIIILSILNLIIISLIYNSITPDNSIKNQIQNIDLEINKINNTLNELKNKNMDYSNNLKEIKDLYIQIIENYNREKQIIEDQNLSQSEIDKKISNLKEENIKLKSEIKNLEGQLK